MNGSFNGGHSSGYGSPQGKFVQRLCYLEEENRKLTQQVRDLLEWKSSIEEYLVDNLDYRPPGVASLNSGSLAASGTGKYCYNHSTISFKYFFKVADVVFIQNRSCLIGYTESI